MRGKTKEKQNYGSWSAFFRMVRQIDLPWLMIALAFACELGYNHLLLSLPIIRTHTLL